MAYLPNGQLPEAKFFWYNSGILASLAQPRFNRGQRQSPHRRPDDEVGAVNSGLLSSTAEQRYRKP